MAQKKNTLYQDYDMEVYENEVYRLADEYILTLNSPDDINNRITFSGMLRYIYRHFFKPTSDMLIYNNRASILDYSNIELLIDVYNIYIDLCCKYKKEYSTNGFLNLTGISIETLNNWIKGIKIPTVNGKPKSLWVDFAKKIKENSEQALSESMLGGNLMAYAQLKCWYGWKEEPTQVELVNKQAPEQIAADIAARHTLTASDNDIQPPEKPEF